MFPFAAAGARVLSSGREELGALAGGAVGEGGGVGARLELATRDVLLEHVGDILEPPELEEAPGLKLERRLQSRRHGQGRVEEVDGGGDVLRVVAGDQ